MPNEVKTLSPDTGLAADISVSDLGSLLGGGSPAAPAATETTPAVAATPAVAKVDAPATEAGTDKTPVAEPGTKTEAEEKTAEPKQDAEKPAEKAEKKDKDQKWWDKRLSDLAAKRREAQAGLETEKKRTEQLQRELDALKTTQPGPTTKTTAEPVQAPTAEARPELATFVSSLKDGEAYEVAVERYTDAAHEWKDRQKALNADRETQQQAFAKDWSAALEQHPDFEDIVSRVRAVAPEGLQVAVTQVQDVDGKAMWPEITMYLDEHPVELAALTAQYKSNPIAAATKLGRIAATLSKPVSSSPTTQVQTEPKDPVVAAKPPASVGGTAAPGVIDLQQTDMNTFASEMRKLGL